MLFHCSWPDRYSILVDLGSAELARTAATTYAGGEAPRLVRPFPANVFLLEIEVPEDGAERSADLGFEVGRHARKALYRLEDDEDEDAPGAVASVVVVDECSLCGMATHATESDEAGRCAKCAETACPSVALDDEDQDVPCELGKDHAAEHAGAGMVWE